MADYQRVIEFLRDVRQGAGGGGLQTVNDEIAHMAGEYAALCVAANERLRKCSGFLQQGLRTEAIHLAEESPNLLDLIAQLDLPDPQSWAEFCQNNGFPVPPALQMERAAQLNEAYAQDQPLEHLLARHRLLALSRSPVRERLDVMRKIAQIDAGSSHWEKDLRIFEQARLKELPASFYNAVKNHDNHAITGLMDELNGQQWYESPPAELLTAVTEAYGRVQRAGAETELRRLVEPLREAFAARSLQECQALVQRWKNAMANAGVAKVSADLMDEIRPVVAFIAEQTKRDDYMRRFHESCKTFSKMLDADASDTQLEAGYAKLKEFKEEIPEEITRRYLAKRAGRRQLADRSHKVRLATIAGAFGVLLVIGIVVAFILMRSSNAEKWAKQINTAVDRHTEDGLREAQKHVDELKRTNPDLLQQPAISKAVAGLQIAQSRLGADKENIRTAITRIEKAREAAAAIMTRPDAPMDEIRSSAGDLDAAINEANEIQKETEWADAEGKLRSAIAGAQAIRRNMQERVGNVVAAELRSLGAELDALPASASTPAAATQMQNQLAALADRAAKLGSLPLLDGAARGDLSAMTERIVKRRQAADIASGVAEELQAIRAAAGSAELRTALTRFTTRFPADSRTADFTAALARLGTAEGIEQWQAKLAAYQGSYAPTNLGDAQKKLDEVTTFLSGHSDIPRTFQAAAYADYLKHAVDALGDAGPWQTSLTPLVVNPLISELDYLEISDGRRYPTLGDPKRTEHKMMGQVSSVSFEAVDLKPDESGNFQLYNADKKPNTVTITIEAPLRVAEAPVSSPQKKVAGEVVDALKLISNSNWDTFGIDLADRLARNDQLDMVVKAILIKQALKTQVALTGSMIGDVYDKTIDSLERQKPEELPWPDPTKISDGTRKSIKSILDQMPPAGTVKQRLAQAKIEMFKWLAPTPLGAGVLLKNDAGGWVISSASTPVSGAVAYTLVPDSSPGAPANLVVIGAAAGGRFELDELALRNVPQGSIVFIIR